MVSHVPMLKAQVEGLDFPVIMRPSAASMVIYCKSEEIVSHVVVLKEVIISNYTICIENSARVS